MGMNLKDIFKENEESLVIDRKKQAMKALIIFAIVISIPLVILLVLKSVGDVDEIRRDAITKDIINIQNYVKNKATEAKEDSELVLPGKSLEEEPITINVNGVVEEYRYGYYLLKPADYKDMETALNIANEQYIVNYDTYDVVNVAGIKFNRKIYYSVDDLIAIENGQKIPSENTIIIKVASDMQKLHQYPGSVFKLAGNIDMKDANLAAEGWKPVEQFTGSLDGRGYTISNLTVNRPAQQNVGLFEEMTSTAKVVNLTLKNVDITGENYTGALAGNMSGMVRNVIIDGGVVTGVNKVGGLVGSHQQGTISNCKVELATVSGQEEVGGLVGNIYSGTLEEVMALVTNIHAVSSTGGLAGMISAQKPTILNETTANTTISGRESLGGLIGKIEILAPSTLEIKNCYSKGTLSNGSQNLGGLVGYLYTSDSAKLIFKDAYTTVNVINKTSTAGGCVGYSDISYASETKITDTFWEKNLPVGQILNDVGTTAEGSTKVSFTDKSYDEMRIRITYTNWKDFDLWEMKERKDTPYLKFEKSFED